jgi:hypothetical protein
MKRIYVCLATAAVASLLQAHPAVADPPAAVACQPRFQPVVGLDAAIDFAETAFGRPLTSDELTMITGVFAKADRNGDNTICVKVAADSPGLPDPVLQAVENHLPVA